MSKDQLLHLIDNQIFALTTLREQITNDEPITAAWMLESNMSEFKAEIATMEAQEQMNFEHTQHIEKGVA